MHRFIKKRYIILEHYLIFMPLIWGYSLENKITMLNILLSFIEGDML